ncbi:MAG TPA: hypothetical protein VIW22_04920 [Nitrososphaerales archaeon]
MTPNTGPTFENLVFDPTLYGLTALVTLVSLGAAILALRRRGSEPSRALGTGLVAIGYAIILGVAISLLALVRAGGLGGVQYLQIEFTAAYAGCATLMYGIDRVMFANGSGQRKRTLRGALWSMFFVSLGIGFAYLLNPLTFMVTTVGGTQHVAQESVFWLPPSVTLIAGAVGLPAIVRANDKDITVRKHSLWLALFFIAIIAGVLKESNAIPSLGDPLVDMLVAFIPFTVGSLCILKSATMLPRSRTLCVP